MSNSLLEARLIKISVDELTKKIFDKVVAEEMVEVNELLNNRSLRIRELIASYALVEDKKPLKEYLIGLKNIDEEIMQLVTFKRDAVKNALKNLGKLKMYAVG